MLLDVDKHNEVILLLFSMITSAPASRPVMTRTISDRTITLALYNCSSVVSVHSMCRECSNYTQLVVAVFINISTCCMDSKSSPSLSQG